MRSLPLPRIRLTTLAATAAAGAVVVCGLPGLAAPAHATIETHYVAPTGSDTNPGTQSAPYRTLKKALAALTAGDTLYVRGGTYAERITSTAVQPGSATARVTVAAYPGERPVVQGLLWLKNASYWDVKGLNVTWDPATGSSSEHMVKLTGGTGWTFTGAEVWGARSYAAILVAGDAANWRLAENYVHDTHPSNGTNQDHLIYANSGSGGGVIERNVLVRSQNGRAVKVGPPSATSGTVSNVVIRYNTMVDNKGPSNVQIAWGTSGVSIYRNIMTSPAANRSAVTAYQLTGSANVVSDNLAWNTPRVLDTGVGGMTDGGGNVLADPAFSNPAADDFRPTSLAAQTYGRYAAATDVGAAGSSRTNQPVVEPVVEPVVVTSPSPTPQPICKTGVLSKRKRALSTCVASGG